MPEKTQQLIETIDDEQTAAIVEDLLDGELSSDDITDLAEIDLEELDDVAVQAIVEVLNDAPQEVKQAVERELNVFSGELDTYIPSGSNVSVAERRTIVAVTATVASPVSPLSTRRRKV